MKKIIKSHYLFFLKKTIKKIKLILNKNGNKRKCNICNNTFNYFLKWQGGSKNISEWIKKMEIIGSDVDNFGCPFCFSHDRERHLFMYFEKLKIWEKFEFSDILHFAPETQLSNYIEKIKINKYIKADLFPINSTIQKIDATNIPFQDSSFDIVIFNHILEHILNYKLALNEIYRVLKPNGIAILQTPYSTLLTKNFEDEGINTDELRLIYLGQEDHVRIFSENQFFQNIKSIGFNVEKIKHTDLFNKKDAFYFGVNEKEDFILVKKQNEQTT